MMLNHVGLFEGYGGTSMAAARALGELNTLWVSDIKPAACTLLDYRKPGVPNLGDITRLFPYDRMAVHRDMDPHWQPVDERVHQYGSPDVLTASWPCQPHSSAGKRLGEEDPRALWPNVARAISELRPTIFLGENVARITSNGELRRVVRSLAQLGYVGAWRVLGASDVYAPHRRLRCFVVAIDTTADPAAYPGGWGLEERTQCDSGPLTGQDGERGRDALRRGVCGQDRLTLLPTPTQSMTTGAGTSGREGGLNLQTAALMLLPTPTQRDGRRGAGWGDLPGRPLSETIHRITPGPDWGVYAEAIARWGACFDREAPLPTQPSTRTGEPVLAPPFVEWMMGLPQGWVCDVPDLAPRASGHRNAALSLLGDGVVPQQGAAAFTFLLDHLAQRSAVAA